MPNSQGELLFGIQVIGIRHRHDDPVPDLETRFKMLREVGLYDYLDATPKVDEVDEYIRLSEKYDIPVLAGGSYYALGAEEPAFEQDLQIAQRLGSRVFNVQLLTHHKSGHVCTDEELVDSYERMVALADKYGCAVSWETHIARWSEDYPRVSEIARKIEARGLEFNLTLDHSHVVFKIDNPDELKIFDTDQKIASGELIIDPFKPGNVISEWIDAGWVKHCHARSAVPNNPKNILGRHPDGSVGRGVQYPFKAPRPGEYHAEWTESALEPWKEGMRQLLAFRAKDSRHKLGLISTEFIPGTEYGEGCKYSLFEHSVACVEWVREEWETQKKKLTSEDA